MMPVGDAKTSKQQNEEHLARKRKRKNPSTGAAEDCFSCTKRGAKCDRRRPYCSQCLELGKECSGYRTTLTWGVGVASRGKLRGRTLPVTNEPSKKAESRVKKVVTSESSSSTTDKPQKQPESTITVIQQGSIPPLNHAEGLRAVGKTKTTASGESSSRTVPIPSSTAGNIGTQFHFENMPQLSSGNQPQTQHISSRPHVVGTARDDPEWSPRSNLSNMSFATRSHSESSYESSNFPKTPDSYPNSDFLPSEPTEHWRTPPSSVPDSLTRDQKTSSIGYLNQGWDNGLQNMPHDQFAAPVLPSSRSDYGSEEDVQEIQRTDGFGLPEGPGMGRSYHDPTAYMDIIPMPIWDSPFVHLPPRMQFILDYYDKMICSVLVAFDDQENPYRQHVLPLAGHNPALQNAIAALVTNNLRMRNLKEVSLLKSESEANEQDALQSVLTVIGKPSMEEQYYKAKAIQMLNSQIASPTSITDDSVLATLLILCLFHVSDSGFSKFKTQLAGVQKLLRMRGKFGTQSNLVEWVEMFFAWFDVMTSAVNDRETQIQNPAILDLRNNLGSLEQFSGCDGRLFKLIARLGRLNLLSQRRPVRDLSSFSTSASHGSIHDPNLMVNMFDTFNPNGFGPSGFLGFAGMVPLYGDGSHMGMEIPDDRAQFWQEWSDIRQRLRSWTIDFSCPNDDMLHISESFRYSALLYTERLAHPHRPSAQLNFQGLVAQSMAHIQEIGVNSCVLKFILWPLFITGTECVEEWHRSLIRDRCVEIQKESGFFNNLSSLELLEKIWRERQNEGAYHEVGMQPFRWRKAMDRVDGEYIVI